MNQMVFVTAVVQVSIQLLQLSSGGITFGDATVLCANESLYASTRRNETNCSLGSPINPASCTMRLVSLAMLGFGGAVGLLHRS